MFRIVSYTIISSFIFFIGSIPSSIASSTLVNEFSTAIENRSKLRIFKQDPQVEELGIRTIVVPSKLKAGPKNYYVAIRQDLARPDDNGDFIFDKNSPEFDSVHTFGVVWETMQMYRKDLEFLAEHYPENTVFEKARVNWDKREFGKLSVYPNSGPDEQNAYYDRHLNSEGKMVRELKFFSFESEKGRVRTCESHDIVAHETGHAILDILHPEYFNDPTELVSGFHEAFGDITAIFSALNQYDLCDALYANTKGDLGQQSFLTEIAEQFGSSMGNNTGLRNLLDEVSMKTVDKEAHSLSRVFTNAVYGILRDAFRETDLRYGHRVDGAEQINRTARHLRRMFLQAVVEVEKPDPTYSDFAYKMYEIALHQPINPDHITSIKWASHVMKNFTARGIPVEFNSTTLDWVNNGSDNLGQSLDGTAFSHKKRICGTLFKNCNMLS